MSTTGDWDLRLEEVYNLLGYVEEHWELTDDQLEASLGGNPLASLCRVVRAAGFAGADINDVVAEARQEGLTVDCSWRGLEPFWSSDGSSRTPRVPSFAVDFLQRTVQWISPDFILDPYARRGELLMCCLDAAEDARAEGWVSNGDLDVAECISTTRNVRWRETPSPSTLRKDAPHGCLSPVRSIDLLVSLCPPEDNPICDVVQHLSPSGKAALLLPDLFGTQECAPRRLLTRMSDLGLHAYAYIALSHPGKSHPMKTGESTAPLVLVLLSRRRRTHVFVASLDEDSGHNEGVWENLRSNRKPGGSILSGREVRAEAFCGVRAEYWADRAREDARAVGL